MHIDRNMACLLALAGILVMVGVGIAVGVPDWMMSVLGFYGGFLMYPIIALRSFEGFMIAGLIPWLATLVLTVLLVSAAVRALTRRHMPPIRISLVGALITLVLLSGGAAVSRIFLTTLFGN